jgi:hypothetical protein
VAFSRRHDEHDEHEAISGLKTFVAVVIRRGVVIHRKRIRSKLCRMEMHAHVPKVGATVAHWLIEGVFIVASVLLAFGVGEFREHRANRELAGRALSHLKAEVEHNRSVLEPYSKLHAQWANALGTTVPSSGRPSGIDAYLAARPALPAGAKAEFPTDLRRGAWDAALSTGVLRLMDYDLVAAFSQIYEAQSFCNHTTNRVVTAVTSTTAFDPAGGGLAIRQLTVDLNSLAFAEKLLADLYDQHLPAIRAAASD